MEWLLGVAVVLIIAFFWWAEYSSHNFSGKEFRLENSRQFIMKSSTAYLHGAKKEDDNHISMVYDKKRYMYKYIRTIRKSYYYRGHREYVYLVLEKVTDSQPPNYSSMEEMRIKEEKRNKKHPS